MLLFRGLAKPVWGKIPLHKWLSESLYELLAVRNFLEIKLRDTRVDDGVRRWPSVQVVLGTRPSRSKQSNWLHGAESSRSQQPLRS
jgi:hypothetical protein